MSCCNGTHYLLKINDQLTLLHYQWGIPWIRMSFYLVDVWHEEEDLQINCNHFVFIIIISLTHSLTPCEVCDSAHDHSDISRDHSEMRQLWRFIPHSPHPFSLSHLTHSAAKLAQILEHWFCLEKERYLGWNGTIHSDIPIVLITHNPIEYKYYLPWLCLKWQCPCEVAEYNQLVIRLPIFPIPYLVIFGEIASSQVGSIRLHVNIFLSKWTNDKC